MTSTDDDMGDVLAPRELRREEELGLDAWDDELGMTRLEALMFEGWSAG
jgi:hypothetical protein